MVEPKGYIYCFDMILLLKCVQEERVGQMSGLFKRPYFIDRLLEQKVIKQKVQ